MIEQFDIKIADAIIRLQGVPELIQGVAKELSCLLVDKNSTNHDILINISSSKSSDNLILKKGDYISLRMSPKARLYPSYEIRFPLNGLNGVPKIDVIVNEDRYNYKPKKITDVLANWAWKFFDRSWMSRVDQLTYSIINSIIEPSCLFLLPEKLPLIHSAGFEYAKKGYLISGPGGIGKTTTSTRLLLNLLEETKFINDDMATLNSEGILYYYPRKIIVYAYNTKENKKLAENIKSTQSFLDKIHWFLHCHSTDHSKMSRRRLSAIDLYGPQKISDSVPLDTIFFLRKGTDLNVSSMSRKMFAREMGMILKDSEYTTFSNFLFSNHLVDEEKWLMKYISSIKSRLDRAKADVVCITLPKSPDYSKIEKIIIEYIQSKVKD